MASDLSQFIAQAPLVDTHEHLSTEEQWIREGPDILGDLFSFYALADLTAARAPAEALKRFVDQSDPDIVGRFEGVRAAWEAMRFTGYGEAVRIQAREVYGMDELTPQGLLVAQRVLEGLRQPGERLRLLRDTARLDHVQTDNFCWPCLPDRSGVEFYFYDINWAGFCSGNLHPKDTHAETGVEVKNLASLRTAQEAIFQKYAPTAIAVKAQHAYTRTLDWRERSDEEASRALTEILCEGDRASEETRLCLGDWSWAHGVELAIRHNLPFKIHTGYYAGNGYMVVDRIKTGQIYRLLQRFPEARFVLMHIAYPYSEELIAMAKHYPNVWVDLCWAWSINPRAASEFVRRFIHTVPINRLFAFGGDTTWPTSSLSYAIQARRWLTRALEGEVADGDLSESQACQVAARLMRDNAYACFDVEGTRRRLAAAARSHPE